MAKTLVNIPYVKLPADPPSYVDPPPSHKLEVPPASRLTFHQVDICVCVCVRDCFCTEDHLFCQVGAKGEQKRNSPTPPGFGPLVTEIAHGVATPRPVDVGGGRSIDVSGLNMLAPSTFDSISQARISECGSWRVWGGGVRGHLNLRWVRRSGNA